MNRYAHDCDACLSLGAHNEFDLHFCGRCDEGSVIARYGSDGSYCSWPCHSVERALADPETSAALLADSGSRACVVAFHLAVAGGHYKMRPKIAVRSPHTFNVLTVDGLRHLHAMRDSFAEHSEERKRLTHVLEKETWEFEDAEKAAAEKLALFDAAHGMRRLLADAVGELRDLNAQVKALYEAHNGKVWEPDSEVIERLESAIRAAEEVT